VEEHCIDTGGNLLNSGSYVYQGYWKNCPSQQLFKVFIYIYFAGRLQAELLLLLRGTVLPITLIKYTQQDAEPQNKKAMFMLQH
jgi:hypothetical protein